MGQKKELLFLGQELPVREGVIGRKKGRYSAKIANPFLWDSRAVLPGAVALAP